MKNTIDRTKNLLVGVSKFTSKHRWHIAAIVLLLVWCFPYFTTGNLIELGDFSFFSQAYEAMRTSILQYHQFPWWNPWMSGGVPLYANPQMGVFSIQMLFALIFGAPIGIKLAIVVYTLLGYASAYNLFRRYFKIDYTISILLGLLWVLCSFFVAHLPSHFTFVWYMVAPWYIYLALTIKNYKGSALLGISLAVMALSQIHNPFMHIAFICFVILLFRLIRSGRKHFWPFLKVLAAAALVFTLLAGHRFILTYENVYDSSHSTLDPTGVPQMSALGPFLPLSMANPIQTINYPNNPLTPYNFNEVSATLGISALAASLICVLYISYEIFTKRGKGVKEYRLQLVVLGIGALCFLTALGNFYPFSPYGILKCIPPFSTMRVSTRWFIGFDLMLLVLIGTTIKHVAKRSFLRFSVAALLTIGVIEMFSLNLGYQAQILTYKPLTAPKNSASYTFEQTAYFGQTRKLPDGDMIPNQGKLPHLYGEYEATTFNLGVIYANDSLVELAIDPRRNPGHPTCAWEEGCFMVRSNNTKITYWSPNKVVLERTSPGPIYLNMNNSNNFIINGKRNTSIRTDEAFSDFVINEPDSTNTITISVEPSPLTFITRAIDHAIKR